MCSSCAATATTVTAPGNRYTGTTSGASNYAGSCGGGSAPEAVFVLTLTQASDVFATTHGSSFNTVLYMRSSCCNGTEVACNATSDGVATSTISNT